MNFSQPSGTSDTAFRRGYRNAWDFYDRQRVITSRFGELTRRRRTRFSSAASSAVHHQGRYMAAPTATSTTTLVFFFTGPPRRGGGSDLDQGDTPGHFRWRRGLFAQDDWRIRRALTLNLGVRWDLRSADRSQRPHRQLLQPRHGGATRARARIYTCPLAAVFEKDFNPRTLGLVISPGAGELRSDHKSLTLRRSKDYNNFAPRIGFAWQPQRLRNR